MCMCSASDRYLWGAWHRPWAPCHVFLLLFLLLRKGCQECRVLPCSLLRVQDLLEMVRSEVRLWRVSLPAPVLLVACGAHHTLAALATGGVVAWGRNNRGQVRAW